MRRLVLEPPHQLRSLPDREAGTTARAAAERRDAARAAVAVVRLYEGDARAEALERAILATVYERGEGLPFPLVLGVLRLVERRLIEDSYAR